MPAIKNKKKVKQKVLSPVWKGPEVDGITQSLLSIYLVCKERFRLLTVYGLTTADHFNHRIEYGNMGHLCEEHHIAGKDWKKALHGYAQELCAKYKTQQLEILHWMRVMELQFPEYIKYWKSHRATYKQRLLLPEHSFKIPYELPSGRVVILRGKWDSVIAIKPKNQWMTALKESKFKGEINEVQIKNQLFFDLQTMMYTCALRRAIESDLHPELSKDYGTPKRILYNVIKRPLSGGKGTIKKLKPSKKRPHGESDPEYYQRAIAYVKREPQEYFMRWDITVTKSAIDKFENTCLIPMLEDVCNWWEIMRDCNYKPFEAGLNTHYRTPYGFYNPLSERGSSDLDNYLETGSEYGLRRVTNLFPELAAA